jgi:glycosyltransferase involved in cell wall biosynthesis
MRICCLSTQTSAHVAVGGMSLQTQILSRAIAARGHDVTIVTTRHPDGRASEDDAGVRVCYLRDTRGGSTGGGWWSASAAAFARLHAAEPFDLVWSQSIGGSRVARRFLRRDAPPPLVSFIHGTGAEMARSLLNALVLTPGGWSSTVTTARRLARCVSNFALVDPPVYARATAIIAVSEVVAASVRTWYRVPSERVFVVPNGVDAARFAPDPAVRARERARFGYADTDRVLLVAGVLTRQKGVDFAIDALARLAPRHPTARLLVAGDGPHHAALVRRVHAHGLDARVRFAGAVPASAMPALYNTADVFLFPTVRVEAFGIVAAEAMAAGLPVVVSRVGAVPEVVAHGETGLLVPPGDPAALARAVGELLEDPGRAAALGARARTRAASDFALAARVDRILAIFESLVTKR